MQHAESSKLVAFIKACLTSDFYRSQNIRCPAVNKLSRCWPKTPRMFFFATALAMELDREGENERSLQLFQELIAENKPYVPAFFMSGQLLVRLGRINEARAVLRSGIDQARRQNDLHAASEMSEFLSSLGELGE